MATGDFYIRRNAAETTAVSTANYDSTWDTLVYDEGSTITYSAGQFTVPDTAPYLVLYNEFFSTVDTTNNERFEIQGEILVNGVVIEAGKSQDYIRKASGQQECVLSGHAIIELTASDTIQIRFYRTDNSTTGTCDRTVDFGGVQILQLSNADAFGIYSTTGTKTTSATLTAITWDVNDRQDTGFSRTGSNIAIANAGRYLVCLGGDIDQNTSTSRTDVLGDLRLNGAIIAGTRSYCYMRGLDGTQEGALSGIYLIDVAANDNLSFSVADIGATTDINAGFSIQIWRIPPAATEVIVEATTGDMNTATDFSWDTLPFIDTADFTHTAGTAGVTVDQIGHYLVVSTLGKTSTDATQRAYPVSRAAVDGTPLTYGAAGAYHRNSGSTGLIGVTQSSIISVVGSGREITTRTDPFGAAGTTTCNSGQMGILNLSSIYTYSFPPSVSDVNTDEQIDLSEQNNVATGTDFGTAQGLGKLEIGPNLNYTGTKITQTIDTWSSTSIQFDFVQSTLLEGVNYVFVTENSGLRSTGLQINIGEGPYDIETGQLPDHYWSFNNTHLESINGNDSDNVTLGTPDFEATSISRSTTHSLRMNGSTDRAETADSNFMNVGTNQSRRDMGGWIKFDTVPLTPVAIYEEGGGVNNFYFIVGFGGILLANVADSSNNFKIQAYSDFKLIPNRPYHILFSFQGNGYNDEFILYIDGVLQTTTDGNPVGNSVMAGHSGDIGWGRPDGTLDTGGSDIQYDSLTTLLLSNWASWSGALSELTVAEIRENLFEQGALASYELGANTNAAMQTALEVFDNTSQPDYPLTFKIRAPTDNSGSLALTATNISFNPGTSVHLMWMGGAGEVLTWRNSGTSNASIISTPNAGTVTLIETATISITVRDVDTSSLLENARVILLANGAPLPTNASISITRVGTIATVTHTAHGLRTGLAVLIEGANEGEYFGRKVITVVDVNTYTFTVSGTPATPATGTITATSIVLYTTTDVNGVASSEIDYVSDQSVIGYVRSSVSQTYSESPVQGVISLSGYSDTVFLIKS